MRDFIENLMTTNTLIMVLSTFIAMLLITIFCIWECVRSLQKRNKEIIESRSHFIKQAGIERALNRGLLDDLREQKHEIDSYKDELGRIQDDCISIGDYEFTATAWQEPPKLKIKMTFDDLADIYLGMVSEAKREGE